MENGMFQTAEAAPQPDIARSNAVDQSLAVTPERGFLVGDPLKLQNAQQHADQLQAHYDFLTTRQRESGMRIRLCSTGCYSIYDAGGHFIGRTTAPDTWSGVPMSQLKTVAARMAHAEELVVVCRQADLDFERTGTVSSATVTTIRELLSVIGAA
jgi:hypothetical protein